MEGDQGGCGWGLDLWAWMLRMGQTGWGLKTQTVAKQLKGRWQQDGRVVVVMGSVAVPSWAHFSRGVFSMIPGASEGRDLCLGRPVV